MVMAWVASTGGILRMQVSLMVSMGASHLYDHLALLYLAMIAGSTMRRLSCHLQSKA